MEGFGVFFLSLFVPDGKMYEWLQTALFSPKQFMENKGEDSSIMMALVPSPEPWDSGPWVLSFIFAKSLWLKMSVESKTCVLP